MDHSQHSNHTHCQSNTCDNEDIFTLKTCLRLTEGRRDVSEKNVAKHDRLKAEVSNLQMKLGDLLKTTRNTKKCFKHSHTDINCELEAITLKYNEILNMIDELERNNQELLCNTRSNSSKEMCMLEKIKKIDYLNVKTSECNSNHQDKINNEKECEISLKRHLCDLEDSIVCKTAEANKLRCVLNNKEADAWSESQRLIMIQQHNVAIYRTVEEMTSEYQVQKAELEGLMKAAKEQLTRVDQAAEAVHKELEHINTTVPEWKARSKKVTKEFSELRATSEAELDCTRSVLAEQGSERIRLTKNLLETSSQLKCMVARNGRLEADARAMNERVSMLVTEVEGLEERKFHEHIALEVQRTKFDGEAMLHEDMRTIKRHTHTVVNNEVEALRRACENREQAIGDAKRILDDSL